MTENEPGPMASAAISGKPGIGIGIFAPIRHFARIH
jgi:hypothetical protein